MVTLGNKGGGEDSQPTEKGWAAPAHTGDPPPRRCCASDTGGLTANQGQSHSDAVVASKQVYCACSNLYKREKLRRLGSRIRDTG